MPTEVSNLTHEIAAKTGFIWLGFSDVQRIGFRLYWVSPQYKDSKKGFIVSAPPIFGKSERDLENKKTAYIGDFVCKSINEIAGGRVI